MKEKILAIAEIVLVYLVIRGLGMALRLSGLMGWEIQILGWSYTGSLVFVGIPALLIWFTRRRWATYGVTLADWPTNLDIGMKAYLVILIFPLLIGMGGAILLGTDYQSLGGGLVIALTEVIAIFVMIMVLKKQKPIGSGRTNLVVMALILVFPVLVALAVDKLSLIIVSTVIWQFMCSGFGEEFTWRGYVQSRLNQVFGRPFRLFDIQFGPGLIMTSLLFGLFHAFNTYDPADGQHTLAWGWALWTTFSGLFFGLLREKTGSLLAPGIAHGLPDAVGESLARVFGWM